MFQKTKTSKKTKLALLVHEGGTQTNLKAIREAIDNARINAEISAVISDSQDATPILERVSPDYIVLNPDNTKALWNKGMYGNKAIQNFLDQKATYAGSSLHFLTNEFDFGPVLGKTFEKIEPDDTVESLYARLKKKENELYVEVLEKLCKTS
ncbi:MAG: hypothetical protein UU30_C0013G0005 [Candidatus Nomurabacteria bacterium GW2011_GWA2_40_97]|nr:MAG: hypothetical protein UU30_C0013G0005 [Candidatus Nomurabacteria bacterium GW2011_GWA2_40_97]